MCSFRRFIPLLIWSLLISGTSRLLAESEEGFGFVKDKVLEYTAVKNQARTSTCWCFATNSFLEAEVLRMGRDPIDFSEMFIVRAIYPRKAELFVRRHGAAPFAAGGLPNNVMHVLENVGLAPESAYPGRTNSEPHDQAELDRVLRAILNTVVSGSKIHPAWRDTVAGTLDAYLGKLPDSFDYEGKQYTPREFADSLGLKASDYVQLTSFTHHPYYQPFVLEIPDNWAMDQYWNLPLDQLMQVMDHAIDSGYSFAWDGDISEKSCIRRKGVAVLPAKPWWQRTEKEKTNICEAPEPELTVTPELRQQQFDNYSTTDDHLMHCVGKAHDRLGTKYFIIKDSYGTIDHENDGLVNMSESYLRAKTIAILLHRDALPESIAKQLGIARPLTATSNPETSTKATEALSDEVGQ